MRGGPAAAEERATARLPHAVEADEVDAGDGRDALALIGSAVRGEHSRYADPREVLAVTGRPDHRADALGGQVDGLRAVRDLALPPVAVQLRLRNVLAAAPAEVADAAHKLARDMVALAQECLEAGAQRDPRAVDSHDVPGEPHAGLPDRAHVEVVHAPAREERERIIGLGMVGVGHDRTVVADVPPPGHLVAAIDASWHPPVPDERD